MTRYDKRLRALAAGLSALAGFVDAIGFIETGGFFVSFMSGNSTRLGVGLAESSTFAAISAGLISAFVLGVVGGTLANRLAGPDRRAIVLAFVTCLLALAAGLGTLALPWAAISITAFVMGAENAVFESEGEVRIGLTYMTGTLVKLGQRITTALLGGEKWAWVPYLLHWLGLIVGAVLGALAHPLLGLGGLWIAAGAAALLAFAAWLIGPDSHEA